MFGKQRLTAVGIRCADHVTPLYPQKLALASLTGGGRSVDCRAVAPLDFKSAQLRIRLISRKYTWSVLGGTGHHWLCIKLYVV